MRNFRIRWGGFGECGSGFIFDKISNLINHENLHPKHGIPKVSHPFGGVWGQRPRSLFRQTEPPRPVKNRGGG